MQCCREWGGGCGKNMHAVICKMLLCVVVPGCAWLCLVVPGCAWLYLVVPGCAWLCLVVPGCAWLCLVVPCYGGLQDGQGMAARDHECTSLATYADWQYRTIAQVVGCCLVHAAQQHCCSLVTPYCLQAADSRKGWHNAVLGPAAPAARGHRAALACKAADAVGMGVFGCNAYMSKRHPSVPEGIADGVGVDGY
jgi:hypothetical protein